jgi:hypothetical protein
MPRWPRDEPPRQLGNVTLRARCKGTSGSGFRPRSHIANVGRIWHCDSPWTLPGPHGAGGSSVAMRATASMVIAARAEP